MGISVKNRCYHWHQPRETWRQLEQQRVELHGFLPQQQHAEQPQQ